MWLQNERNRLLSQTGLDKRNSDLAPSDVKPENSPGVRRPLHFIIDLGCQLWPQFDCGFAALRSVPGKGPCLGAAPIKRLPQRMALVFPSRLLTLAGMELSQGLRKVQERVAQACRRAGRQASEVTLVAVTKGQPPQEAKAKIPLCLARLRWHMIGHLQTNKARDAVHFFEMIQSIDSLRLAEEVNRCAEKAGRTMPILLEVNVAGEASKFGYRPETLLAEFDRLNGLRRLEIHGLMTMAPWTPDPEKVRPVFRRLRELKAECEARLGAPLEHLSMGMSSDFEVAIEEGATIVRVGTAIFGERHRSAPAASGG